MTARQAAQRLAAALKADPLANAHGAAEPTGVTVLSKDEAERVFGSAAPALVWEGGPFEWAIAVSSGDSLDSDYRHDLGDGVKQALAEIREAGFYCECSTSFALSVYSI